MLVSSSAGNGRVLAGLNDYFMRPSRGFVQGQNRGIMYAHQGGTSAFAVRDMIAQPGSARLMQALAAAGYPIAATSYIPPATVGTAAAVARVAATVTAVKTAEGGASADPVIAIGISNGFTSLINHFYTNPSSVAAIVGILPLWDLDMNYQTNPGGVRSIIEQAWGITYPTSLPADSDPRTHTAPLNGKPTRLYYASDDGLFNGGQIALALAAFGANCECIDVGALGHGDAAINAIDKEELIAWIKEVAPL
jgi:hypothetical protein